MTKQGRPSQDERETWPEEATRDSHEILESYCRRSDTGISGRLKTSISTYWEQENSKTRMKERYKKQGASMTISKTSRKTWMKEEKKRKE